MCSLGLFRPNVDKLRAKRNVRQLVRVLNRSKNIEVRAAAARALGQIGDARAAKSLISARQQHIGNRFEPANGQILGALLEICRPNLEPLIGALKDSDLDIRIGAVEALEYIGSSGDTRAVEPLILALKGGSRNVREKAARALGLIGDTQAVGPLIDVLKDRNIDVRSAVRALGQIGDTQAVEPLIDVLKDRDKDVRSDAARALGQIGDALATEPLIEALNDSERDVQLAAIHALGQIGDARAIEPLICELKKLRIHDYPLCKNATKALDQLGWQPGQDQDSAYYWLAIRNWDRCIAMGTLAVEPLIIALNSTGYLEVVVPALRALAQVGDVRSIESFIKYLSHPVWKVRIAAAQGLIALYHHNMLDETERIQILAIKPVITAPHEDSHADQSVPDDYWPYEHIDSHVDRGIGLPF